LSTDERVRIDPAAVAALYAAHGAELRAFLMGVLRDGELAQDALQGTFTKAVEFGHTAHEESLKSWLFSVAYREALAIRQRQAIDRRALLVLATIPQHNVETPAGSLARRDSIQEVRNALERLTPEQRIIVQKKIYEDKTFAVIASELAIPLGTVLTRMRTALKHLQQRLNSNE
jgi:RNA polymerase sigma-70 factor (ECF subfamily)